MEQGRKSADPTSHRLRRILEIVESMYVPLDDAHSGLLEQKYDAIELLGEALRIADRKRCLVQKLQRELHKRNARFARYARKHGAAKQ
jgi:hypothetical protein